jgi:cytosine/adenosine deaminase-related metal-dependent hydrolase
MPGMVDGHRHLFSDLFKRSGQGAGLLDAHCRRAQVLTPEALWQGGYVGGMTCVDSGVTSVVDYSHYLRSRKHADAAAAGALASGVGGVWAPQLMPKVNYGKGDSIEVNEAFYQVFGPPDPAKGRDLAAVRDKHFTGPNDVLQFGVALTAAEWTPRSSESLRLDFELADRLEPALKVQHVLGARGSWRMGETASYRLISEFHRAGLLGPKYLVAHGVGLTEAELGMLAEKGCSVCSTTPGEFFYGRPSIHGRAWQSRVRVSLGVDNVGTGSNDYFAVVRAARTGLSRDPRDVGISLGLTPLDFLKMATISGAEAIGQGSTIGSITPGKRADLVLLRIQRDFYPRDRSTAENVFTYANVNDIDSVWVAGKLRKTGGKLIGFDWVREEEKTGRLAQQVIKDAATINLQGTLIGTPFPGPGDF